MKKRRGRKRGIFCTGSYGVTHRLDDSTRRWKYYLRVDGSAALFSNGCRLCNAIGNKLRESGVSA